MTRNSMRADLLSEGGVNKIADIESKEVDGEECVNGRHS